jgi:hypothetical protein
MKKCYTLAEIAEMNEAAGGLFFARATMRFFGDTRRSFAVRHLPDGTVELERVRPMRDRSGRSMGGVGKRYRVNLETGAIWTKAEVAA